MKGKNRSSYFDLKQELQIYKYVCQEKMSYIERRELENNNREHMYTTYAQWREYVEKKFEHYSKDELEEFSRYLNHRIRINEPSKEYWNIMISSLMASIISIIMNKVEEISCVQNMPLVILRAVFVFLGISALGFTLAFFLKLFLNILWDENTNKNFYIDYKEIIDEMKQ